MYTTSTVKQLLLREYGLSKSINYDFALGRLRVAKEDSWRGIAGSAYDDNYNPDPPIFSAKFANVDSYRHILAIANEDGKIALQDTTKRNKDMNERRIRAPHCHFNAVFDIEWVPNKMSFLSASGDHTARLWNVTNGDIRSVTIFSGHTRSVKTLACRRDHDEVFASGARDGAIFIWDMRTPLEQTTLNDNCIQSGHGASRSPSLTLYKRRSRSNIHSVNGPSSTVTGLIFQDEHTLISCGSTDGIIKVWDLRRNYSIQKKDPQPKYSIPYAGTSTLKGYTNLIADQTGTYLYASCMDNTIYAFNISSYDTKPLARYRGANIGTFYIKSCLSPDNKYLASGSSDNKAYIWNLEYPDEPLISLNGHNVEVTCVAWGASHDQPLVTCSDDARYKIWRISGGVPKKNLTEQYCGHAEFIRKFTVKPKNKSGEDNLQNHLTEGETLLTAGKRNLSEYLNNLTNDKQTSLDDMNDCMQIRKKAKILEQSGRQLFSIANKNGTNDELPCSSRYARHLYIIPEDVDQEKSASLAIPLEQSPPSLLNPLTSNLPNFVLNGEAPHLTLMSPKHQHHHQQVKVDWLTNIRKQKLLSLRRANMNEKPKTLDTQYTQEINLKANSLSSISIINTTATNMNTNNTSITNSELCSSCLSDSQLQSSVVRMPIMRANSLTPKRQRRSSHSLITRSGGGGATRSPNLTMSPSSNSRHHIINRQSARTPTSSRRNSETTLLRFFSRQRATTSPIKGQENQENFPGNDQQTAITPFKDTNEQHRQQHQQNNNIHSSTITYTPHT